MADRIFINYRREDSIGTAGRLRDRLAEAFGEENLFMDVDNIPAGVDFVADLNGQVAACRVFLAVIGPNWLDAKDESGVRRLDNPDDFVTIEIAAALARDIRVIPVLVDNARMPKADKLPDPIKPLVRRNAVEIRNTQFGRDAETLVARMREALGGRTSVARGREAFGRKSAKPGRWRVLAMAGVAAVAVLLLIGWGGNAFIQKIVTTVERTVQLQREAELKAEQDRQAKAAAEAEEKEAERKRLAALKAEQDRQSKAAAEAEEKEAERKRLAALKAEQDRQSKAAAEAEEKEAERKRLAALKAEQDRQAKAAAEIEANYPSKPITMIVPFAPGGPSDLLGRVLAERMSEIFGKPVVVDNVVGANGARGSKLAAEAAPDGYRFVYGNILTHAQHQALNKTPLYDAATDFTPVALVSDTPMILFTRPGLGIDNLKEFIAYAKANQSTMKYGSGGVGSMGHFACEMLNIRLGIKINHAPSRGATPAVADLKGNRIDYMCAEAIVAKGAADSVKLIATLAKDRSKLLPNVPTAHEQGLSDFELSYWSAIFLPKGTPAAIVSKLRDAAIGAVKTPIVQERFEAVGYEIVPAARSTPGYLAQFVNREIGKWIATIMASGVPLQ